MPDGFSPMRHGLLAGSFLALLAALVLLWNHRYERVPGLPTWRLEDLRAGGPEVPGVLWTSQGDDPALRLQVDAETPRVEIRLPVPWFSELQGLHFRYRVSARGGLHVPKSREIGKLAIEWHSPGRTDRADTSDLVQAVFFEGESGLVTLVARPRHGSAIPSLYLTDLVDSAEIEFQEVEITPVNERAFSKAAGWLVALGFLAWLFTAIRCWPGVSIFRAFCAAMIILLMGVQFVIPGPWNVERPIGGHFNLGKPANSGQAPPLVVANTPPMIAYAASAPGARDTGWSDRVRGVGKAMAELRPLRHVLLLFAPVLAVSCLLGRRRTFILMIPFALATELAQIAFGYGFDWIDGFDLALDGLGIILGIWMHGRMESVAFRKTAPSLCPWLVQKPE